jgi:hypothetical protein
MCVHHYSSKGNNAAHFSSCPEPNQTRSRSGTCCRQPLAPPVGAVTPPPILLVWLLGVVTPPPLSWLGDPLLKRLPGGWDLTTGGVP